MTYIKQLNSPDFKSSIEEKWNSIKGEKISDEEKTKKWTSYINELKNIGSISKEMEIYLISEYTF